MSKVTRTYKQMQVFDATASAWMLDNGFVEVQNGSLVYTEKENTKFSTALRNVLKQWGKLAPEMQDEILNLQDSNAATNPETRAILKNPDKSNQYTPEGAINLRKEIKQLINTTTVEIHQRIVNTDDIPVDLTEEEKEAFSELVIPLYNGTDEQ